MPNNSYKLTVLDSENVKRGLRFEEPEEVTPRAALFHALAQFEIPADLRVLRFEKVDGF